MVLFARIPVRQEVDGGSPGGRIGASVNKMPNEITPLS